ncbi:wall-associated kinase 2 [Hibiscus trionum]|uniref:Wall-associated kinase 2 n=1 Tax=Hibiscus trionum TaxID=183268 RepID=A0A9W7M6Q5_HIBTR|nr:wall-associated kinase 2 [Hibiscus trionum]
MGKGVMRAVLMLMLTTMMAASVKKAAAQAKPGCRSHCGDVFIPYPFGTDHGCNISDDFFITCNTSVTPNRAFLTDSNIQVVNISLDGYLRILISTSYDCYDYPSANETYFEMWLELIKFPVDSARNKFTAIGCDTDALIQGFSGEYDTGCMSFCNSIDGVINGSCSGIGCCQTAIPKGVMGYNISLGSYNNHSHILLDNPCSYAFVAEDGAYNFSNSDLSGYDLLDKEFPVVLDWTIGNISCREAIEDMNSFACKGNSTCVDSENTYGYLCKCFHGYEGTLTSLMVAKVNIPILSACDGWKNGTACIRPIHDKSPLNFALGIGFAFIALLLGIALLLLMLRQRQIGKLRQKYFLQNGGNLLQHHLSQREGCGEKVKVFAAVELEKATNSYHESRILGQGGQGTVYKGTLPDGRSVAIKKSRIGDHSQVEPFINEITVLYHINHRNVVKLLGCCLETPVPLLVYEYVTNGTLFDHLHNAADDSFLPWDARFRIATETAEALSYLHSAASVPIIHRDIKLANILLDDNYTAKVSDFGASRLIASDQAQITTIVQGTFGYLDPEYMHTGQLTEKSDVYSFGVVLIELLTGQKVVCFKRSAEHKILPMHFVSLMKEDRLLEILDPKVLNYGNVKLLKEVALLARRCVRMKGEDRPTMKEVAHELAGLQAISHPWGKSNSQAEETEYLLGVYGNTYGDGATGSSLGYDSINNRVTFELEGAR